MTELQGKNGGFSGSDKSNAIMNWKKLVLYLAVIFVVSLGSSVVTWHQLSHKKEKQISWKEILNLTPDQEKKFSALESEFNIALKDISIQDAQNKIFLCSYLGDHLQKAEIKSAIQKMTWVYQKKQERIASTLVAMSAILTPDQKRIFSKRLMKEACSCCSETTGTGECLCGMCKHKLQ